MLTLSRLRFGCFSKLRKLFFPARNAVFLARNAAFLARNAAFLTRNAAFLTRNVAFLTRNVAFLTRNAGFLTRNAMFLTRKSLSEIAVKVVSGKCVVVREASREMLANGEEADFVRKIHNEASVKEACEKRAVVRVFFLR
jgi:hypothetical protein